MGSLTIRPQSTSRSDTIPLAILMISGAGIATWTLASAAGRIAELVGGGPVRVRAQLAGTDAGARIAAGAPELPIEIETARLVVPDPTMTTVVPLVLEQVLLGLVVLIVIACLLAVAASIMRGRVFSSANTRLVGAAGAAAILGAWLVPLCATVGANDAIAQLLGSGFVGAVFVVEPFALVSIAFVVAIAITTFGVGDRLRRDTDGLV
ncbi:hypothetical protein [Agrococcus sp. TF02-05]|uniref:hypothetical protein n=1 Tax=Agrococcus sp. TF02-05 TaxID=2815211 RepID=UPI001FB7C20A|nr:hypothetical protein [Agrococcus sp. TF02-05]